MLYEKSHNQLFQKKKQESISSFFYLREASIMTE